jgi:hypothetical protein
MDLSYPSRVAKILLAQHHSLRELFDTALAWTHAEPAPGVGTLAEVVGRIAAELDAHNRLEEEALEPLLRRVDAWGPERISRMLEHHRAEHAAFVDDLCRLSMADDPAVARAALAELAEAVSRHMDQEERDFLNARVLRDDIVALDASGG